MSTIPLPHAAIVQSIQSVQPFAPGDILMIQSATTQANIPVLVLGINKLDPTQFTVDTSTDPDTVKINSSVVAADPPWTPITPTISSDVGVPTTTTALQARYLRRGKTIIASFSWTGTFTGGAAAIQVTQWPIPKNNNSSMLFAVAATCLDQTDGLIPLGAYLEPAGGVHLSKGGAKTFPNAVAFTVSFFVSYEEA